MAYERILYEKIEGNIAKVTMNRPEKRNALDYLMREEIQDAFIEADLDEEVRVIILAGAGKDFCAGHDQSGTGLHARGPIIGRATTNKLTGMEAGFRREEYVDFKEGQALRNVSKPTIAMIQGNCYAGGWFRAAMCDLLVVSEDARFTDPLVQVGPAASEILFHPYDLGFRRAKEILWLGDPITAQEAKQLGMVSRIFPREKLEEETLALARRIAASPPVSVSLIKRSINQAWDLMGQKNAWEYHMLAHQLSHASDEAKRLQEARKQAVQRGGVKEMLKTVRDATFEDKGKS
ncbi:MAG: enoyl-CoA hydratase [Dehalococcoidales bacterium]|nr:enoyl-CoA hydratase [Dehalococcoidales bacterium]